MSDISAFAEHVLREIRKDIDAYSDTVANGGCVDFSLYQNLCGKIRGLKQAEEYIKTLQKKVDTDHDIDE